MFLTFKFYWLFSLLRGLFLFLGCFNFLNSFIHSLINSSNINHKSTVIQALFHEPGIQQETKRTISLHYAEDGQL